MMLMKPSSQAAANAVGDCNKLLPAYGRCYVTCWNLSFE